MQESQLSTDRHQTRETRIALMQRDHALGEFETVLPYYLDEYRSRLSEHGREHIETLLAMRDLAEVYAQLKRYDDAEPLFREALDGLRNRPRNDPIVTLTETYLATMYTAHGKHQKAEPLLSRGVDVAREQFGPADSRTAGSMAQLGLCLLEQQKWSAAEAILRECLAIREKVQPDHWVTFNARSMLGASLAGQGRYVEAEPLVVSGFQEMKAREARCPTPRPRLAAAAGRVITLYESWGKNEQAALWRSTLGLSQLAAAPSVP